MPSRFVRPHAAPFQNQVSSSGPVFAAVVVVVVKSECPQGSQPLVRIADTIADTHIPTATPKIAAKTIVRKLAAAVAVRRAAIPIGVRATPRNSLPAG